MSTLCPQCGRVACGCTAPPGTIIAPLGATYCVPCQEPERSGLADGKGIDRDSLRSPNVSECFNEGAIYDLIIWNAPDHDYTRMSLQRRLEAELDEAFALYEALGGDNAI